MTHSPETIELEIRATKQRISDEQQRLARLEDELKRARAIRSAETRHRDNIYAVIARMQDDDYIVVGKGGPFWCRDGQLLERAGPDEMEAVYALRRQGAVEHGERTWRL